MRLTFWRRKHAEWQPRYEADAALYRARAALDSAQRLAAEQRAVNAAIRDEVER